MLLVIPVLVYSLFFIYPIGYTVYLSFMKWNGMAVAKKTFIGLQNYKTLFSQAVFWHSLKKRGGIYGCQPCGHLSGFLFTCPACI